MGFSKKILFSRRVSSASMSIVCLAIRFSFKSSPALTKTKNHASDKSYLLRGHTEPGFFGLRPGVFKRRLCAPRKQFAPVLCVRCSAFRRNALGNLGIRGSNRAPKSHRALSAGSYRADERDAATPRHPSVRPAPDSDRSDTCALPRETTENTFYLVSIKSYDFRESSDGGGKKFIALNAGGDAATPLLFLHAQDARVATDVNVAGKRDLLRQR